MRRKPVFLSEKDGSVLFWKSIVLVVGSRSEAGGGEKGKLNEAGSWVGKHHFSKCSPWRRSGSSLSPSETPLCLHHPLFPNLPRVLGDA